MGLEALFQAAVRTEIAIALWRLPLDTRQKALVDLSGKILPERLDLEELESGFVFSPFFNPDGRRTLFLRGDLIYDAGSDKWIVSPLVKEDPQKADRQKKLMARLESLSARPARSALWGHHPEVRPSTQSRKRHYCEMVRKGIEAIQRKKYKKLVLCRTKAVSLGKQIPPFLLFQNLCHLYPEGFISLVSIPDVGTWMGVSPSVLMRIDQDGVLRTVALGGTRPLPAEGPVSDNFAWGEKEIAEQAFIARFVADCIKKNGVKGFRTKGPHTVRAGNLLHLETEFTVELKKSRTPHLVSRLLGSLHPSPAICGNPTDKAMRFILDSEGYDRRFYAGFLGPVRIDGESRLYVNLRCMQLHDKKAILYVGAGITEKSDPEKEWEETEEKCNTLLKAIGPPLPSNKR